MPAGVQPHGHIKTDYDWTNKTIYDVIATIPGTTAPDEWVMAGNHYDAWVNGADDPVAARRRLLKQLARLGSSKTRLESETDDQVGVLGRRRIRSYGLN